MGTNDIKYTIFFVVVVLFFSCHSNPYKQGERIYEELCSNCHMKDGSGLGTLIPSLNERIPQLDIGQQVCLIQSGIKPDSIGLTMGAMPGFSEINDINMTNLINFLNYEWREGAKENRVSEIRFLRKDCK